MTKGRVPSPLTEALSHLYPISPGLWATKKKKKRTKTDPLPLVTAFLLSDQDETLPQKKSKMKDAKSGQTDESAATSAKKSRKPYPGLGDANLPMQTTHFLFFLESIGELGNGQSQIATPRHCQANVLQPREPRGDADVPT